METPFIFGKIATEKNFTDREKETANLVQNFMSLINTIIISPRRWGKSSLVNKAAKLAMAQESNLRICHIDLFNVRNEEHFYSLLAQKVIAATSTKWEEAIESAKSFFSHLVPKISIGTAPINEVSIDFDWEEVKHNPDEVLDLAEKIAFTLAAAPECSLLSLWQQTPHDDGSVYRLIQTILQVRQSYVSQ